MKRPKHIERCHEFPNVTKGNHAITSDEDIAYNCIAFAAGLTGRRMWPTFDPDWYWPRSVRRTETVDSFVALYESYGYSICADGAFEEGMEKIAIWSTSDGRPTHASRQIGDNSWSSKLGASFDIEHRPNALAGGLYGTVRAYLSRPK